MNRTSDKSATPGRRGGQKLLCFRVNGALSEIARSALNWVNIQHIA